MIFALIAISYALLLVAARIYDLRSTPSAIKAKREPDATETKVAILRHAWLEQVRAKESLSNSEHAAADAFLIAAGKSAVSAKSRLLRADLEKIRPVYAGSVRKPRMVEHRRARQS